MPPRKNSAPASKTMSVGVDGQAIEAAQAVKKAPSVKKSAPSKKVVAKKAQDDGSQPSGGGAEAPEPNSATVEPTATQGTPASSSVLAPQATSSARTPGKTGGQKAAGSGAASKTPVKPKGRIRKMPKSPEYVSSGSERDEPVAPLVFPAPPQTPVKETRKRPAVNYAESDSDGASNPSPKKKSRAAAVVVDEEEDGDEEPLNETASNPMVDDIAEEDDGLGDGPEGEDDDGMEVDEEGDDCEEKSEEEGEEEQEADEAVNAEETAHEDAADDVHVTHPNDEEDIDEDVEAAEDDEDPPSSDLTALPDDDWDEEAFYLEEVPTEKTAGDIKPGTLPPSDLSVSAEAKDPELIKYDVYDDLKPLVPGLFVAPANAIIDFDPDAMTIMSVENWIRMGVLYRGPGPAPHRKAMSLDEFVRIMSFKQAYSVASPSFADPTNFVAKFIGSFSPSNESLRWEAHLNGYTCLFVDPVGVVDSNLTVTTNAFGTSLRFISAIDHRFNRERKMAFFNTIFRKRELELRMIDATTYSYETKPVGSVGSSATTATPKKNVFGSAAKIAYNASPVKASSSPAKARSNRPHTFDANEEVPIYDGTDPKKPVPTGFKMMDLGKHLDRWHGEVPAGALALVGYIAQMFYWRDVWRLKFYVQWVVVLGVPGKSVNDALKDGGKKDEARDGVKKNQMKASGSKKKGPAGR